MQKDNKVNRSFRFSRQTIALMNTYAREHDMSNTAVVELAIKRLCRQSSNPATQQDVAALADMMRANQVAMLAAIESQPIAALEAPKQPWYRRLFAMD